MKLFILRLFGFLFFSIGLTILLWVLSFFIIRNVSFEIPHEKTIVIIGDSHPECAINDEILSSAFNFSQSGTSLFYSYVKLRELLDVNPHIEKIVVGYNYEDVTKSKNNWVTDFKYLKSKLPKYFPWMTSQEFLMVLKLSPIATTKALFASVVPLLEDIVSLPKDISISSNWGGYLFHKKSGLEENLKILKDQNKPEAEISLSGSLQLKYLQEIYNLSTSLGKEVILINTPIYTDVIEEKRYLSFYEEFARKYLPEATLYNHASLDIPVEGYADTTHLNYIGAKIYSEYLKDNELL